MLLTLPMLSLLNCVYATNKHISLTEIEQDLTFGVVRFELEPVSKHISVLRVYTDKHIKGEIMETWVTADGMHRIVGNYNE